MICLASAKAQPTLMVSSFPVAGDIFGSVIADTIGITAGTGGTGATWDFSTLVNTTQLQLDTFLMPEATPYSGVFSTVDLSKHSVGVIDQFFYYKIQDSIIATTGLTTPVIYPAIPTPVSYTDFANAYKFPFTYRDSFNDTYHYSYTIGTSVVNGGGTVDVTGDGYGTLITPSGTYNNVLRITSIYHQLDTVILDTTSMTATTDMKMVNWYSDTKFFPLMSINEKRVTSSMDSVANFKNITYLFDTETGINQTNAAFSLDVYPNPVINNQLTVEFENQVPQTIIEIKNVLGQVMYSDILKSVQGRQTIYIDLTEYPSGIYFVTLTNKTLMQSKKVVKA